MTERTLRAAAPGTVATGTAPRTVLIIVTAGVVLAGLDLFVVNVALPQIARDLGTANLGELSWVLNGYAIVYASLLVFFGRMADRYRRDLGFLIGVAVFTAASAACAAASSVAMLVGFRLVQAAGAALLTPTSLGLVLAAYEPDRRAGAVRAWTATSGVAAALGPVIGGLLVTASWRWVFLINVPIGIAALVAGWRLLPHIPGHATEPPDPLGVILATAGVAVLTFGLVEGSDWGWGSASVGGTLTGAAVLIALFVVHCLRARNPLIDPALFRSRGFTGASLVALFFSAAFGAMLLSIVLWEQGAWGWSALRAGLAIAPGPLMVPLVAFGVAGRHRPPRARPGHRPGRRGFRRGRGVVGGGDPGSAGLRHGRSRRDDDHGHRSRTDAADPDGRRLVLAAASVIRDRIRRDQHAPADRTRPRRGHSGGGARPGHLPRRRGAGRIPAWLVGDRRLVVRQHRPGPGPAQAPARGGTGPGGNQKMNAFESG